MARDYLSMPGLKFIIVSKRGSCTRIYLRCIPIVLFQKTTLATAAHVPMVVLVPLFLAQVTCVPAGKVSLELTAKILCVG